MSEEEYRAVDEIIRRQEEMLQFEQFNNEAAWELGKLMVEEVRQSGVELAICIRKLNGNIVFQYTTEQTSLNNQNWMNRKFNTVYLMERSSLGVTAASHISKQDVADHGLSPSNYVFCGGGFPVRIRNGGIVAVITVSNLPHVQDHEFIVKCLEKYLKVSGVPHVETDI
jgi:uncharacterized protein (UPF0303 family)